MISAIRVVVESKSFNGAILGVIILAALLVGLETYPSMMEQYGVLLHRLDTLVLWVFVLEAALKMAQHGKRFYRYFGDPWNVFDFSIVAVCFLPVHASYAAVLRLARILRSLRLMTALPKLQLLVSALLKSVPSMAYVGLLLFLMFYVYGVMGVFLFGGNDPLHFRDLQTAMLSLFRVVTLEDWTDIMYLQIYGSDTYAYDNISGIEAHPKATPVVGVVYFVSFVMLGTMIMLNLFIGVILKSMDDAQRERTVRQSIRQYTLADELEALERQAGEIVNAIAALRGRQALTAPARDGDHRGVALLIDMPSGSGRCEGPSVPNGDLLPVEELTTATSHTGST